LNFIDSVSNGTSLIVSLNPVIFSYDNSTLFQYNFTVNLFEFEYISETFKEIIKKVRTVGQSSSLISFCLAMLTNPSAGWVLQNNIQMIAFLPLSSNPLTPAVNQFCKALINFYSPVNLPSRYLNKDLTSSPSIQAKKIGIKTIDLWINIGTYITIFVGILLLFPIVLLISKLNLGKISQKFQEFKFKYKFSVFLRFWLQSQLVIGFFTFLNFESVSFRQNIEVLCFQSILGKVSSIILIVIFIQTAFLASPAIILIKLWSSSEKIFSNDGNYLKRFGTFFRSFIATKNFFILFITSSLD
jgi:hypothetical protein